MHSSKNASNDRADRAEKLAEAESQIATVQRMAEADKVEGQERERAATLRIQAEERQKAYEDIVAQRKLVDKKVAEQVSHAATISLRSGLHSSQDASDIVADREREGAPQLADGDAPPMRNVAVPGGAFAASSSSSSSGSLPGTARSCFVLCKSSDP